MKWKLLTALIFTFYLVTPAQAVPDPLACTGYAEPRIFVESQGWWMTTPGANGKEFGHLHTALCFPFGQTASGVVPFDIRLMMHENPGVLRKIAIQVWNGGTGASASKALNYTCTGDCVWWVHLDVDMSKHPWSGWQEVRIRPSIHEPDGNDLIGSTSYQLQVANGKPVKNYREQGITQGKGWYSKGTDYAQAQLFGFPPSTAVTGRWSVQVGCHSSSLPVSACLVTIDPNFHMGDFGQVQLRHKGEWRGTLAIDTAVLAPGPHRLVIRADVNDPRGSTLSGLLVVPFKVAN